jgi:hypothetical protein
LAGGAPIDGVPSDDEPKLLFGTLVEGGGGAVKPPVDGATPVPIAGITGLIIEPS